jgi:hypothetical protein
VNQAVASKLVTPPTSDVVSLQSLKDFLRIDGTQDDAFLYSTLRAATQKLESYCDCKFVTQTWDIYYQGFPYNYKSNQWWDGERDGSMSQLMTSKGAYFTLPFGPLQSLTSLTATTDLQTEIEIDLNTLVVDTVSHRGRISLRAYQAWPSTPLSPITPIKARVVLGFGAGYVAGPPIVESQVPHDIQAAVKNFAAVMFEHRGDEYPELPASVGFLLEKYREIKL